MNLNLFENRERNNDNIIGKFLEELNKALKNLQNKNDVQESNMQENNVLEDYNLYEKRKVFLDNKSRNGNDLAWIMDEKSVCISEHGDGGPYSIIEKNLPQNAKVGEVYEKVNGTYAYNPEITKELNEITISDSK